MSIVGIESVTYGVDDILACTRFYERFGLPLAESSTERAMFQLAEGSRVVLLAHDDPALPPRYAPGNGVREVIWGVSDARSLDALERDLGRDRAVMRDQNAIVRCADDAGIALGFKVFERKSLLSAPSPTNAPGLPRRQNQHRKWYRRAEPKLIYHVVFRTPNHARAAQFYRERLGFRLSDVSRGLGMFMRADGHSAHHNLFLMESPTLAFDHVCFGVEDIDELMTGANRMRTGGYVSKNGLGRHRIGSALFYYLDNPCGGEAEYGADMDQLDDRWIAREWEPLFGLLSWAAQPPAFMPHEASWDARIIVDEERK